MVDERARISSIGDADLSGFGDPEERIFEFFKNRLLEEARSRTRFREVSLETSPGSPVETRTLEVKAAKDWVLDLDVPMDGAEFKTGWGSPDFVLLIGNVSLGLREASGIGVRTIDQVSRVTTPARRATRFAPYQNATTSVTHTPRVVVTAPVPTRRLHYRSSFVLWDNHRRREVAHGYSDGSMARPVVPMSSVTNEPMGPHYFDFHWNSCARDYLEGVLGGLPF
ncbi:MAG: hypothetical protein QM765_26700 [Myxococcales bacterium]